MKKKIYFKSVLILFVLLASLPLIYSGSIINNAENYSSCVYLDDGMALNGELDESRKQELSLSSKEENGNYVYIGGTPIGIVIGADGLMVIGSAAVDTNNGAVYPMDGSEIKKGDIITYINGDKAVGVYQLRKAVEDSKGDVELTIKRKGEEFRRAIKPAVDKYGEKRIGILAKEDVGGVGTLTFVTKDGSFAGLGHHIVDPESGLGSELQSGKIFPVEIDDIQRGERGKAGGLIASVNRMQIPLGTISKNSNIGLYGKYSAKPEGSLIRIADAGEVKMGKAQVLTTINGSAPKFYDIDIVKVVSQTQGAEKGLVIAVRDRELLDKAGGIVQGMSGSPIIQNGLLVGAVTHVFISDPTRGYAVHSRFMLDNADRISAAASLARECTYESGAVAA